MINPQVAYKFKRFLIYYSIHLILKNKNKNKKEEEEEKVYTILLLNFKCYYF
jgi:hypothetical protein